MPVQTFHLSVNTISGVVREGVVQQVKGILRLVPSCWSNNEEQSISVKPEEVSFFLTPDEPTTIELVHPEGFSPAWKWRATLFVDGLPQEMRGTIDHPAPGATSALLARGNRLVAEMIKPPPPGT